MKTTKNPTRTVTLLLAVVPSVWVQPGQAELISADDPTHGVGGLTLDTDTGLAWLDLNRSLGLTYEEVVARSLPGDDFEGFRHATTAEVEGLFSTAGIEVFFTSAGAVDAFHGLFGSFTYTVGSATLTTATGLFEDGESGADPALLGLAYAEINFDLNRRFRPSIAAASVGNDRHRRDEASAGTGHFLVRVAHPPRPTGLDLVAASDTGRSDRDNRTRDVTPSIAGRAPAGSTVTLLVDGTPAANGPSDGSFLIQLPTLPDGARVITATAASPGEGSSPASNPLTLIIDSRPPPPPTGLELADAGGGGGGAPGTHRVTRVKTPEIRGQAEPGSRVEVFAGPVRVASALSDGTFSVETSPLALGPQALTAIATDVAGNASDRSEELSILVLVEEFKVTVEQAGGQLDPAQGEAVTFTAVFNRPASGFGAGDVSLVSDTGATTTSVAELEPFDGTTWSITVTGMQNHGAVTVSIPAGVARDAAGSPNLASTSRDNRVTWRLPIPTALISLDDPVHGAGSLTWDASRALEWLDLDRTIGLSYDEVRSETGPGGAFEGFRHATADELRAFWTRAGILPFPFGDTAHLVFFHRQVGAGESGANGLYDDAGQGRDEALVGLGYARFEIQSWLPVQALLLPDSRPADRRAPDTGHWLVRARSGLGLTIARAGGDLLVSWVRVHDDLALFQSDDLQADSWVPATPRETRTEANVITAVFPLNKARGFFQLRLP